MKLSSAIRPLMIYVKVALPADLLADIEIYARSQSSPSRSETIRQLLQWAIEIEPALAKHEKPRKSK